MSTTAGSGDTKERILRAASQLLTEGGTEAVSTRAVSARAGVQQPTLYRLFGDKSGLLDALASYGFEHYLAEKKAAHAGPVPGTPLEYLAHGWNAHVAFGLAQPGLYLLLYGPAHTGTGVAAAQAYQTLLTAMEKLAADGALRVPPDLAARMLQSAAVGVTLRLLAGGNAPADVEVSDRVRDAVLDAVLAAAEPAGSSDDGADGRLAARALRLAAVLDDEPGGLTPAEAGLLREWLRRLATRR